MLTQLLTACMLASAAMCTEDEPSPPPAANVPVYVSPDLVVPTAVETPVQIPDPVPVKEVPDDSVWRPGRPDAAPVGWFSGSELRLLQGSANLDDRYHFVGLGTAVSPHVFFGYREGCAAVADFSYLGVAQTGNDGGRRRFEFGKLDLDLQTPEIRPARLLSILPKFGVGAAYVAFERRGGGFGDVSAPMIAQDTTPATIPIPDIFSSDPPVQTPSPTPARQTAYVPDPRSQADFGRHFWGATVHGGANATFVLGRSGFALFGEVDGRIVADANNAVYCASFRGGLQASKRIGRYRVFLSSGYMGERWWAVDNNLSKSMLADFYFNGPFAQAEFKF